MTDDSVYLDFSGNELIRCSRADGAGIQLVHYANSLGLTNIRMMILSSETNPVAHRRAQKLDVECHTGIERKFEFLIKFASDDLKVSSEEFLSNLVYFGNDLNDLKIMKSAFLSVAPYNSHPMVKKEADLVLDEYGGAGFVRAAIEYLLGSSLVSEIVRKKYD